MRVTLSNPGTNVLAMRYLRGCTVLAEGNFTLN